MGRIHAEEYWEDGDIFSPDEPNREFGAIAGEMNGHVSVDNTDALLVTGAKVALDAFHELLWVEDAGPDTYSNTNGDEHAWTVVATGTIATGDGRVKLEGQMTYDSTILNKNSAPVELAVLLDGDVVARSGMSGQEFDSESLTCSGCPPVAPGSHTVELVFRTLPSWEITVNARSVFGRYLAR